MNMREAILKFIRDYVAEKGYSPSQQEIAEGVWIAVSGVHRYLHLLELEGKVEFLPIKHRNIRLLQGGMR